MKATDEGDRTVRIDGEAWRATAAWRAADGSALCYFRPAAEEGSSSSTGDRRARLPEDRSLETLEEEELEALFREAAPLTDTERRFLAPDGREWLAQNVGPVWAEEDAAEGATGLLLTALDGSAERLRTYGGHVGRTSAAELEEAWRRAGGEPATDGEEAPGGGG